MSDWRTCPACRLRFWDGGDGLCPRCRRPVAHAVPPGPSASPRLPAQGEGPRPSRSPSARPRVWPIFLTLGLAFLVIQVAGLIFFVIRLGAEGATLSHLTPQQLARVMTDPYTLIGSAFLSGSVLLITAGAAGGFPGVDLRLGAWRLSGFRVLLIVVGGLAASVFLDQLVSWLLDRMPAPSVLHIMKRALAGASGGTFVAALLIIGPLVGAAEEAFFRGLVQTRLTARWGPWVGVLVSSAAFGVFHGDAIQAPFAFLVGLYLGWMTEVAGSIVPAMIVHVLNNTASVLEMSYQATYSASVRYWLMVISGVGVVLVLQSVGRRRVERPAGGEPERSTAPPAQRAAATVAGASPQAPVRVLSGEAERRRLALATAPRAIERGLVPLTVASASLSSDPAAELRFVVRRLELTPAGLRLTDRHGEVWDVPFAETEELVVRRLPPDQPWNAQLLADLVVRGEGQRRVVRLVGTTPISLGELASGSSGSRLESVRSLAALLIAHNPSLVIDPDTAAFAKSAAPAGRFVDMTAFTEYDARYG